MASSARACAAAAGFTLIAWIGGLSNAAADPYDYGWSYSERPPVGHGQQAAPAVLPLGAGVGVVSPYQQVGPRAYVRVPHYQGPDGSYDSLVDLSREVNGVPCGIGCQARALRRWGYTPVF